MPVFRLTPIRITKCCGAWKASTINPECLWLNATDEQNARNIIVRATSVDGLTMSPWRDPALVACAYDDRRDVPAGIIRVRRADIARTVTRRGHMPDLLHRA